VNEPHGHAHPIEVYQIINDMLETSLPTGPLTLQPFMIIATQYENASSELRR